MQSELQVVGLLLFRLVPVPPLSRPFGVIFALGGGALRLPLTPRARSPSLRLHEQRGEERAMDVKLVSVRSTQITIVRVASERKLQLFEFFGSNLVAFRSIPQAMQN